MELSVWGPAGEAGFEETADARVLWRDGSDTEVGSAAFSLPLTSPLCREAVLPSDGGALLRLADAVTGTWWGVSEPVSREGGRVSVTARPLEAVLLARPVGTARAFTGLTAGAIVRAALRDACGGTPFRAGAIAEAPPVVPRYEFAGQTLGEVFRALAGFAGCRWQLNGDGTVDWLSAGLGTPCPLPLVEGGTVVETRPERRDPPVVEIVAVGGDRRTVRWAGTPGLLGRQLAVSVDGASGLDAGDLALHARQAALGTLPRRRWTCRLRREPAAWPAAPSVTVTPAAYGWARALWGRDPWGGRAASATAATAGWPPYLREGDRLLLVRPGVLVEAPSVLVRVIGRELEDGSAWLTLHLQEEPGTAAGPAWRSERFTPAPPRVERLTPYPAGVPAVIATGSGTAPAAGTGPVVTRYGGPLPSDAGLPNRAPWVRAGSGGGLLC